MASGGSCPIGNSEPERRRPTPQEGGGGAAGATRDGLGLAGAPPPPSRVRAPPPPPLPSCGPRARSGRRSEEGESSRAEWGGRRLRNPGGLGGGQRLATEAGGLGEGEEKPKTKEVGRGGGSGELTRGEVAGAQEDGNTGKTFPFVLEHLNVASGQGLGQRGSLSLWPGPAPVPAPAQGISPAGSGCQKPFHPSHCLHEASLPPPWARQPLLLRVQEPFPRPRLPSRRSTSSSCFGSGFFF